MPDREELNRLFDEAVALPADQRTAFVESVTSHDPELRRELESLIARDARLGTILDMGFDDLVGAVMGDDGDGESNVAEGGRMPAGSRDASALERVGPYRLLREVGRGGMGTVFLAEREDGEFQRTVAVKLVKRGMDSDEILRRFRSERQILATLEHPNIARMYDGGVAEDGRPYLAMEFVAGRRITDYADEERLSIVERLALFDDVAAAVRFAHLNLVVHRDLKPSNVLVTDDGTVKLLDFGIAKLLDDQDGADDLTRPGRRVLTPAYAAPEQLSGDPVTTATDVFSLGVLLHELLTGRRPRWLGDDPVLPSTTVRMVDPSLHEESAADSEASRSTGEGSTTDASALSELRSTTPTRLSNTLRGDLDAIMLRALQRDPRERYASVEGLMADLLRHKEGLPVLARRTTASYRLARFVRRHRVSVTAGAAVFVALAAGMGVALSQRNTALEERATAEATTEYLEGLFASAHPFGAGPGADTLTVAAFVEQSAEAALSALDDQPVVRGRLLRTLGKARVNLGDLEGGRDLYQAGLAAFRDNGLPVPNGLVLDLGEAAALLSDHGTADSLLDAGLRGARREGSRDEEVRALRFRARLALSQGRTDEAEGFADEALAVLDELEDRGDGPLLSVLKSEIAWQRQEVPEAKEWQERAVEGFRALRGPDDPQVAIGLTNLSVLQRASGELTEAAASIAEALRIVDARLPSDHTVRVNTLSSYANILTRSGDLRRADSLFVLAGAAAAAGNDTGTLVVVYSNHAQNRRQAADTAAALTLAQAAVEAGRTAYGDHPALMDPLVFLAMMQDFAGDTTAGDGFYEEAVRVARDVVPMGNMGRMVAERGSARAQSRQGRHAEAEGRLLALLERTPEGTPAGTAQFSARQATLQELARLYRRWGRALDAERIDSLRVSEASPAN